MLSLGERPCDSGVDETFSSLVWLDVEDVVFNEMSDELFRGCDVGGGRALDNFISSRARGLLPNPPKRSDVEVLSACTDRRTKAASASSSTPERTKEFCERTDGSRPRRGGSSSMSEESLSRP